MSKRPFMIPNVPDKFKDLDDVRGTFQKFQSFADSVNQQIDPSFNYTEVTAAYSVKSSDDVIVVNSASSVDVTIPLISVIGSGFQIMVIRAGAGAVTVKASGSEKINASATYSLASQWDSVTLNNDGTKWVVTSNKEAIQSQLSVSMLKALDSTGVEIHDDGDNQLATFYDGGIVDFPRQSGASVYNSTTSQSISALTWTVAAFNAENYDLQGEYNTSTYRFTVTKAGKYLITMHTYWEDSEATTWMYSGIRVNNSMKTESPLLTQCTNDVAITYAAVILNLAANDYVEWMVYNGGTVSHKVYNNEACTYGQIQKVA